MKTVKQMKEELDKFPDAAVCYGLLGGLRIMSAYKFGLIYCGKDRQDDLETEVFNDKI